MGKPKTDRTQQLHEDARRYTLAQQANRAIEQHNFDKLVRQGVVVLDETLIEITVKTAQLALNQAMGGINQAVREQRMLNSEGRGRGKAGAGEL